jgi:hypothetical protein
METRDLSRLAVNASLIQGYGAFATTAIRRGSVILQLDDSRIVDSENPLRPENQESLVHLDYLPDGTVVLMRSPECYINHSCQPNSYIYSANQQRFLLAKRDLASGEEVVVDYALNAVDGDWWECRCETPSCRRYHKCDFFELSTDLQCEYLPYLDPWFAATHSFRIHLLLASGPR